MEDNYISNISEGGGDIDEEMLLRVNQLEIDNEKLKNELKDVKKENLDYKHRYDEQHCTERNEDGTCKKCTKTEDEYYEQCLSKLFGCVEAYFDENCLECDDLSDVGDCTGCMEGFELDENHNCIEIEENRN